jgi:hypothetical protein
VPAVVTVGQYFTKKLSLATGHVWSSSCPEPSAR